MQKGRKEKKIVLAWRCHWLPYVGDRPPWSPPCTLRWEPPSLTFVSSLPLSRPVGTVAPLSSGRLWTRTRQWRNAGYSTWLFNLASDEMPMPTLRSAKVPFLPVHRGCHCPTRRHETGQEGRCVLFRIRMRWNSKEIPWRTNRRASVSPLFVEYVLFLANDRIIGTDDLEFFARRFDKSRKTEMTAFL